MQRITKLGKHLHAEECSMSREELTSMMEDRSATPDKERLFRELDGPVRRLGKVQALTLIQRAAVDGKIHEFWDTWVRKTGNPGTNIAFYSTVVPKGSMPYLDAFVVIANPKDAQRLARIHVKKSDTYGIAFLGDGVLSTQDLDSWKEQRSHVTDAFLPLSSLQHIFPISLQRAKFACDEKLMELSKDGAKVEINEFFLHEAMAQLQLGLLGETTEFMEETNKPLRSAFAGALNLKGDPVEALKVRSASRKTVHAYSNGLLSRSIDGTGCPVHSGSFEMKNQGAESIHGPLAARISDFCPVNNQPDKKINRDNASTFLFAGHDTTANLMTHFVYEMAKRPHWQLKIQKEADEFFANCEKKGGMEYLDLKNLPIMKVCLNETLRLWPSVPNGTFREIQFDETIEGTNGELVVLKKGTNFVVPAWTLQHNELLWGDDAWEFNPDREWLPEETWYGNDLAGFNPESYRFCPFTFTPRDCIGKNFAQMEARIILVHLFHKFNFALAEPTKSMKDVNEISVNGGTLGPKDGLYVYAIPR